MGMDDIVYVLSRFPSRKDVQAIVSGILERDSIEKRWFLYRQRSVIYDKSDDKVLSKALFSGLITINFKDLLDAHNLIKEILK